MTLDVLSFRLTRMAGRLVSIATCALTGRRIIGAAVGLGLAFGAQAADVLIINYNLVPTTDTNLQTRLQLAGNTATIISSGALPTDLSMYSQVWDLGANAAISSGYANTITSYLQGGGTMFMMGENSGYGALRNAALSTLLGTLGGGPVTTGGYSPGTQAIIPELLTVNNTSSVTFNAVGKFTNVGSGLCITIECGAAAWGAGTLSNAMRGSIVSVLDVNFLDSDNFQPLFTDNLIGYLVQQGQIGNGPSATDIGTGAASYDASNLGTTLNPVFHGGTLNIDAPNMTLAQNFAIGTEGGTIQAVATNVTVTGTIADDVAGTPGALTVTGAGGRVTLQGVNTYTGATTVAPGTTLALSGAGSIATSSTVVADGTLDVSAASAPAAVQSLGGSGRVELGANSLVIQHGANTFGGVVAGRY